MAATAVQRPIPPIPNTGNGHNHIVPHPNTSSTDDNEEMKNSDYYTTSRYDPTVDNHQSQPYEADLMEADEYESEEEKAQDEYQSNLMQFKGNITAAIEHQIHVTRPPASVQDLWDEAYGIAQLRWSRVLRRSDMGKFSEINNEIKRRKHKEHQFPVSILVDHIGNFSDEYKRINALSQDEQKEQLRKLVHNYRFACKAMSYQGVDFRRTLPTELKPIVQELEASYPDDFLDVSPSDQNVLRKAEGPIQSFFEAIDDQDVRNVDQILGDIKKIAQELSTVPEPGFCSYRIPVNHFEDAWNRYKELYHVPQNSGDGQNNTTTTDKDDNSGYSNGYDLDPDATAGGEPDSEPAITQNIPDSTPMIHAGWKNGITPYGEVRFVRFAGRGSYRIFLNAGTPNMPFMVVRNGSDFPRGCAEEWFQKFKSESNHTRGYKPETFEALDFIQTAASPYSNSRRLAPAYFYGLENGDPTIWTKSEAISRCGKKTTLATITQRLIKRDERQKKLQQARSQNVHPDTGRPLDNSDREHAPWLLRDNATLNMTEKVEAFEGPQLTKMINPDEEKDLLSNTTKSRRRHDPGSKLKDLSREEMLVMLQHLLERKS